MINLNIRKIFCLILSVIILLLTSCKNNNEENTSVSTKNIINTSATSSYNGDLSGWSKLELMLGDYTDSEKNAEMCIYKNFNDDIEMKITVNDEEFLFTEEYCKYAVYSNKIDTEADEQLIIENNDNIRIMFNQIGSNSQWAAIYIYDTYTYEFIFEKKK